ncbi:hypothetical protein ACFL1E_01080 [Candidatus Omnitrophota bacterium]
MSKAITALPSFKIFKHPMLACGSDVKNTFCLGKKDSLFVSSDNGDLENVDNFLRYEKNINSAKKRFHLQPRVIAYDMHPEYHSAKFAVETLRSNAHLIGISVQHHEAHIASCMFSNNLTSQVIGISFDGTGFGSDGKMWGGEFFVGNYKKFSRIAHLRYIPIPGGAQAIFEPWRIAFSQVYDIYKGKMWDIKIDFIKKLNKRKCRVLQQMIQKNINCPLTSSMGRLFDAVSALIGIRGTVVYEAQAAIELEKEATKSQAATVKPYRYALAHEDCLIIDVRPMFREIIADIKAKVPRGKIAFRFHYTVARMICDVSAIARKKFGVKKVVLSGGVFQNKLLLSLATGMLKKEKFRIFTHTTTPTNDSGISIGQLMIAQARMPRIRKR